MVARTEDIPARQSPYGRGGEMCESSVRARLNSSLGQMWPLGLGVPTSPLR